MNGCKALKNKKKQKQKQNKTQQKWHPNVFWRSILFYHPTLHETFAWNNLTLVEKGTWSGRLGNLPRRPHPTYRVNAMRDFMDRQVIPAKRFTSHTRGPGKTFAISGKSPDKGTTTENPGEQGFVISVEQ